MGTEHYITDLTLWWVFTTWMAKTAAMGKLKYWFISISISNALIKKT